jgi:hypothetical protein
MKLKKMRNWLAVHAHNRNGGVHENRKTIRHRVWRFWEDYDPENPQLVVNDSTENEDIDSTNSVDNKNDE